MRIIRNIINLILITFKTYRAHRKNGAYHSFVTCISSDTVEKSKRLNDGSIPEKLYLKKQWYKVSTLFMGELLGGLLGRELSKTEKKSLVYLGAVMGLCDVLVDDYKINKDHIFRLLEGLAVQRPSAIEKVFVLYYQELLNILPEDKRQPFVGAFKTGVQWQMESLKQLSAGLTQKEVYDITYGKGGISIVLCKIVLDDSQVLTDSSMMELGAFIQAMNDAQDLPKDTRENVLTFVHYHSSFSGVINELKDFKNKAFREVKALNIPDNKKSFFLFCFFAMYTAISYKLNVYSKICNETLDFDEVSKKDKTLFRTNPYSFSSLKYCFKRIIRFNFKKAI